MRAEIFVLVGLLIGSTAMSVGNQQSKSLQDIFIRPRFCNQCVCGLANQWTRIVGGSETQVNEYPWVTALTVRGIVGCGATLINDLFVITAAHCFGSKGPPNPELRVILSEHNLLTADESRSEIHSIDRVLFHPSYVPNPTSSFRGTNHDIALVKLVDRVRFRRGVMPACLPPPHASYAGYDGIITGWGFTAENGVSSDVLMSVVVSIPTNQHCLATSNYTTSDVTDNQMCAGYIDGGHDSCQGDSGGSLIVQDQMDRHVLAGIVSWGLGCARPNAPGIYTRVNKYLDWIAFHTQDACYCFV